MHRATPTLMLLGALFLGESLFFSLRFSCILPKSSAEVELLGGSGPQERLSSFSFVSVAHDGSAMVLVCQEKGQRFGWASFSIPTSHIGEETHCFRKK